MSDLFPAWVTEPANLQAYPKGNPKLLMQLGKAISDMGEPLRQVSSEVDSALNAAPQFYNGAGAVAFENAARPILSGPYSMPSFAHLLADVGAFTQASATQMTDTQWQMEFIAAQTLQSLIRAAYVLATTPWGQAAMPTVMAAVESAGLRLVEDAGATLSERLEAAAADLAEQGMARALVKRFAVGALTEGLKGLGVGALIQTAGIVNGSRNGFDAGELLGQGLTWAGAGAFHTLAEVGLPATLEHFDVEPSGGIESLAEIGAGTVASASGMWGFGIGGQALQQFVDTGQVPWSKLDYSFSPTMLLMTAGMEVIGGGTKWLSGFGDRRNRAVFLGRLTAARDAGDDAAFQSLWQQGVQVGWIRPGAGDGSATRVNPLPFGGDASESRSMQVSSVGVAEPEASETATALAGDSRAGTQATADSAQSGDRIDNAAQRTALAGATLTGGRDETAQPTNGPASTDTGPTDGRAAASGLEAVEKPSASSGSTTTRPDETVEGALERAGRATPGLADRVGGGRVAVADIKGNPVLSFDANKVEERLDDLGGTPTAAAALDGKAGFENTATDSAPKAILLDLPPEGAIRRIKALISTLGGVLIPIGDRWTAGVARGESTPVEVRDYAAHDAPFAQHPNSGRPKEAMFDPDKLRKLRRVGARLTAGLGSRGPGDMDAVAAVVRKLVAYGMLVSDDSVRMTHWSDESDSVSATLTIDLAVEGTVRVDPEVVGILSAGLGSSDSRIEILTERNSENSATTHIRVQVSSAEVLRPQDGPSPRSFVAHELRTAVVETLLRRRHAALDTAIKENDALVESLVDGRLRVKVEAEDTGGRVHAARIAMDEAKKVCVLAAAQYSKAIDRAVETSVSSLRGHAEAEHKPFDPVAAELEALVHVANDPSTLAAQAVEEGAEANYRTARDAYEEALTEAVEARLSVSADAVDTARADLKAALEAQTAVDHGQTTRIGRQRVHALQNRIDDSRKALAQSKWAYSQAEAEAEARTGGDLRESIEAAHSRVELSRVAVDKARSDYGDAAAERPRRLATATDEQAREAVEQQILALEARQTEREAELRAELVEREALLWTTSNDADSDTRTPELEAALSERDEIVAPEQRAGYLVEVAARTAELRQALGERESAKASELRLSGLRHKTEQHQAEYFAAVADFKSTTLKIIAERLAELDEVGRQDWLAWKQGRLTREQAFEAIGAKRLAAAAAVVDEIQAFDEYGLLAPDENDPKASVSDEELQKMIVKGSDAIRQSAVREWIRRNDPDGREMRREQLIALLLLRKGPVDMKTGEGKKLLLVVRFMQQALDDDIIYGCTSSDVLAGDMFDEVLRIVGPRAAELNIRIARLQQDSGIRELADGERAIFLCTPEDPLFRALKEMQRMIDVFKANRVEDGEIRTLITKINSGAANLDQISELLDNFADAHQIDEHFFPFPKGKITFDEFDMALRKTQCILSPGSAMDAEGDEASMPTLLVQDFLKVVRESDLNAADLGRPRFTGGYWDVRWTDEALRKFDEVLGRELTEAEKHEFGEVALMKWAIRRGTHYIVHHDDAKSGDKVLLINEVGRVQWDREKSTESRLEGRRGQYLDILNGVAPRACYPEDALRISLDQGTNTQYLQDPSGISATQKHVEYNSQRRFGSDGETFEEFRGGPTVAVPRSKPLKLTVLKPRFFFTRERKLEGIARDILRDAEIVAAKDVNGNTIVTASGRPQWILHFDNRNILGDQGTKSSEPGWRGKHSHEMGIIDFFDMLVEKKYGDGVSLPYTVTCAERDAEEGGGSAAEIAAIARTKQWGAPGSIHFGNMVDARGADPTPDADSIVLGGTIVRIDGAANQLESDVEQARGRAARNGNPGTVQDYNALEDLHAEVAHEGVSQEIIQYTGAAAEFDSAEEKYQTGHSETAFAELQKARANLDAAEHVLHVKTIPTLRRVVEDHEDRRLLADEQARRDAANNPTVQYRQHVQDPLIYPPAKAKAPSRLSERTSDSSIAVTALSGTPLSSGTRGGTGTDETSTALPSTPVAQPTSRAGSPPPRTSRDSSASHGAAPANATSTTDVIHVPAMHSPIPGVKAPSGGTGMPTSANGIAASANTSGDQPATTSVPREFLARVAATISELVRILATEPLDEPLTARIRDYVDLLVNLDNSVADARTLNLLYRPAVAVMAWTRAVARLYAVAEELRLEEEVGGETSQQTSVRDRVIQMTTRQGYWAALAAVGPIAADSAALRAAAEEVWVAERAVRDEAMLVIESGIGQMEWQVTDVASMAEAVPPRDLDDVSGVDIPRAAPAMGAIPRNSGRQGENRVDPSSGATDRPLESTSAVPPGVVGPIVGIEMDNGSVPIFSAEDLTSAEASVRLAAVIPVVLHGCTIENIVHESSAAGRNFAEVRYYIPDIDNSDLVSAVHAVNAELSTRFAGFGVAIRHSFELEGMVQFLEYIYDENGIPRSAGWNVGQPRTPAEILRNFADLGPGLIGKFGLVEVDDDTSLIEQLYRYAAVARVVSTEGLQLGLSNQHPVLAEYVDTIMRKFPSHQVVDPFVDQIVEHVFSNLDLFFGWSLDFWIRDAAMQIYSEGTFGVDLSRSISNSRRLRFEEASYETLLEQVERLNLEAVAEYYDRICGEISDVSRAKLITEPTANFLRLITREGNAADVLDASHAGIARITGGLELYFLKHLMLEYGEVLSHFEMLRSGISDCIFEIRHGELPADSEGRLKWRLSKIKEELDFVQWHQEGVSYPSGRIVWQEIDQALSALERKYLEASAGTYSTDIIDEVHGLLWYRHYLAGIVRTYTFQTPLTRRLRERRNQRYLTSNSERLSVRREKLKWVSEQYGANLEMFGLDVPDEYVESIILALGLLRRRIPYLSIDRIRFGAISSAYSLAHARPSVVPGGSVHSTVTFSIRFLTEPEKLFEEYKAEVDSRHFLDLIGDPIANILLHEAGHAAAYLTLSAPGRMALAEFNLPPYMDETGAVLLRNEVFESLDQWAEYEKDSKYTSYDNAEALAESFQRMITQGRNWRAQYDARFRAIFGLPVLSEAEISAYEMAETFGIENPDELTWEDWQRRIADLRASSIAGVDVLIDKVNSLRPILLEFEKVLNSAGVSTEEMLRNDDIFASEHARKCTVDRLRKLATEYRIGMTSPEILNISRQFDVDALARGGINFGHHVVLFAGAKRSTVLVFALADGQERSFEEFKAESPEVFAHLHEVGYDVMLYEAFGPGAPFGLHYNPRPISRVRFEPGVTMPATPADPISAGRAEERDQSEQAVPADAFGHTEPSETHALDMRSSADALRGRIARRSIRGPANSDQGSVTVGVLTFGLSIASVWAARKWVFRRISAGRRRRTAASLREESSSDDGSSGRPGVESSHDPNIRQRSSPSATPGNSYAQLDGSAPYPGTTGKTRVRASGVVVLLDARGLLGEHLHSVIDQRLLPEVEDNRRTTDVFLSQLMGGVAVEDPAVRTFLLRYELRLSARQVATMEGVSPAEVRRRYRLVTKALRDRMDTLDRLHRTVFGESATDAPRAVPFDRFIRLLETDRGYWTVPSGAEELAVRLRAEIGEGADAGPEAVRSLLDALTVYMTQSADEWMPASIRELRDYRDWLAGDDSADPVRRLLRELGGFVGWESARAGWYEGALRQIVRLLRHQHDLDTSRTIGLAEIVEFAHELIDNHRPHPLPDVETVRGLLRAAQAAELYGLREHSENREVMGTPGSTENRTEYRVLLGELARLLEFAQTETALGGTGSIRGLEGLAARLADEQDPFGLRSRDPLRLLMFYRRVRRDGEEGDHGHGPVMLADLSAWRMPEGFSDWAEDFDSVEYALRNYGYRVLPARFIGGQWIPRIFEARITDDDREVAEGTMVSLREFGYQTGDFRDGLVHFGGVNPAPESFEILLGVECPTVVIYHRNISEIKQRKAIHNRLDDLRRDGILRYIDENGIPRKYRTRKIWTPFYPMLADCAARAGMPGGFTSDLVQDHPIDLRVGNIFSSVLPRALELIQDAERAQRFREAVGADDASWNEPALGVPWEDAERRFDIVIEAYGIDSFDSNPLDTPELIAEKQRLARMTPTQRIQDSVIDRHLLALDAFIDRAEKVAICWLALNDGTGYPAGVLTNFPNIPLSVPIICAYADAHPRIQAIIIREHRSGEVFSPGDAGLGSIVFSLVPSRQEKGPGRLVVDDSANDGVTRARWVPHDEAAGRPPAGEFGDPDRVGDLQEPVANREVEPSLGETDPVTGFRGALLASLRERSGLPSSPTMPAWRAPQESTSSDTHRRWAFELDELGLTMRPQWLAQQPLRDRERQHLAKLVLETLLLDAMPADADALVPESSWQSRVRRALTQLADGDALIELVRQNSENILNLTAALVSGVVRVALNACGITEYAIDPTIAMIAYPRETIVDLLDRGVPEESCQMLLDSVCAHHVARRLTRGVKPLVFPDMNPVHIVDIADVSERDGVIDGPLGKQLPLIQGAGWGSIHRTVAQADEFVRKTLTTRNGDGKLRCAPSELRAARLVATELVRKILPTGGSASGTASLSVHVGGIRGQPEVRIIYHDCLEFPPSSPTHRDLLVDLLDKIADWVGVVIHPGQGRTIVAAIGFDGGFRGVLPPATPDGGAHVLSREKLTAALLEPNHALAPASGPDREERSVPTGAGRDSSVPIVIDDPSDVPRRATLPRMEPLASAELWHAIGRSAEMRLPTVAITTVRERRTTIHFVRGDKLPTGSVKDLGAMANIRADSADGPYCIVSSGNAAVSVVTLCLMHKKSAVLFFPTTVSRDKLDSIREVVKSVTGLPMERTGTGWLLITKEGLRYEIIVAAVDWNKCDEYMRTVWAKENSGIILDVESLEQSIGPIGLALYDALERLAPIAHIDGVIVPADGGTLSWYVERFGVQRIVAVHENADAFLQAALAGEPVEIEPMRDSGAVSKVSQRILAGNPVRVIVKVPAPAIMWADTLFREKTAGSLDRVAALAVAAAFSEGSLEAFEFDPPEPGQPPRGASPMRWSPYDEEDREDRVYVVLVSGGREGSLPGGANLFEFSDSPGGGDLWVAPTATPQPDEPIEVLEPRTDHGPFNTNRNPRGASETLGDFPELLGEPVPLEHWVDETGVRWEVVQEQAQGLIVAQLLRTVSSHTELALDVEFLRAQWNSLNGDRSGSQGARRWRMAVSAVDSVPPPGSIGLLGPEVTWGGAFDGLVYGLLRVREGMAAPTRELPLRNRSDVPADWGERVRGLVDGYWIERDNAVKALWESYAIAGVAASVEQWSEYALVAGDLDRRIEYGDSTALSRLEFETDLVDAILSVHGSSINAGISQSPAAASDPETFAAEELRLLRTHQRRREQCMRAGTLGDSLALNAALVVARWSEYVGTVHAMLSRFLDLHDLHGPVSDSVLWWFGGADLTQLFINAGADRRAQWDRERMSIAAGAARRAKAVDIRRSGSRIDEVVYAYTFAVLRGWSDVEITRVAELIHDATACRVDSDGVEVTASELPWLSLVLACIGQQQAVAGNLRTKSEDALLLSELRRDQLDTMAASWHATGEITPPGRDDYPLDITRALEFTVDRNDPGRPSPATTFIGGETIYIDPADPFWTYQLWLSVTGLFSDDAVAGGLQWVRSRAVQWVNDAVLNQGPLRIDLLAFSDGRLRVDVNQNGKLTWSEYRPAGDRSQLSFHPMMDRSFRMIVLGHAENGRLVLDDAYEVLRSNLLTHGWSDTQVDAAEDRLSVFLRLRIMRGDLLWWSIVGKPGEQRVHVVHLPSGSRNELRHTALPQSGDREDDGRTTAEAPIPHRASADGLDSRFEAEGSPRDLYATFERAGSEGLSPPSVHGFSRTETPQNVLRYAIIDYADWQNAEECLTRVVEETIADRHAVTPMEAIRVIGDLVVNARGSSPGMLVSIAVTGVERIRVQISGIENPVLEINEMTPVDVHSAGRDSVWFEFSDDPVQASDTDWSEFRPERDNRRPADMRAAAVHALYSLLASWGSRAGELRVQEQLRTIRLEDLAKVVFHAADAEPEGRIRIARLLDSCTTSERAALMLTYTHEMATLYPLNLGDRNRVCDQLAWDWCVDEAAVRAPSRMSNDLRGMLITVDWCRHARSLSPERVADPEIGWWTMDPGLDYFAVRVGPRYSVPAEIVLPMVDPAPEGTSWDFPAIVTRAVDRFEKLDGSRAILLLFASRDFRWTRELLRRWLVELDDSRFGTTALSSDLRISDEGQSESLTGALHELAENDPVVAIQREDTGEPRGAGVNIWVIRRRSHRTRELRSAPETLDVVVANSASPGTFVPEAAESHAHTLLRRYLRAYGFDAGAAMAGRGLLRRLWHRVPEGTAIRFVVDGAPDDRTLVFFTDDTISGEEHRLGRYQRSESPTSSEATRELFGDLNAAVHFEALVCGSAFFEQPIVPPTDSGNTFLTPDVFVRRIDSETDLDELLTMVRSHLASPRTTRWRLASADADHAVTVLHAVLHQIIDQLITTHRSALLILALAYADRGPRLRFGIADDHRRSYSAAEWAVVERAWHELVLDAGGIDPHIEEWLRDDDQGPRDGEYATSSTDASPDEIARGTDQLDIQNRIGRGGIQRFGELPWTEIVFTSEKPMSADSDVPGWNRLQQNDRRPDLEEGTFTAELEGYLLATGWREQRMRVIRAIVGHYLQSNGLDPRQVYWRTAKHEGVNLLFLIDRTAGGRAAVMLEVSESRMDRAALTAVRAEPLLIRRASTQVSDEVFAYVFASLTDWPDARIVDVARLADTSSQGVHSTDPARGDPPVGSATELQLWRSASYRTVVFGVIRPVSSNDILSHGPAARQLLHELSAVWQATGSWEADDAEARSLEFIIRDGNLPNDVSHTPSAPIGSQKPERILVDLAHPATLDRLHLYVTLMLGTIQGRSSLISEPDHWLPAPIRLIRTIIVDEARERMLRSGGPLSIVLDVLEPAALSVVTVDLHGRRIQDQFGLTDGRSMASEFILVQPFLQMTVLRDADGRNRNLEDACVLLRAHMLAYGWTTEQALAARGILGRLLNDASQAPFGVLKCGFVDPSSRDWLYLNHVDLDESGTIEVAGLNRRSGTSSLEAVDHFGDPWLAAHYRELVLGDMGDASTEHVEVVDLSLPVGVTVAEVVDRLSPHIGPPPLHLSGSEHQHPVWPLVMLALETLVSAGTGGILTLALVRVTEGLRYCVGVTDHQSGYSRDHDRLWQSRTAAVDAVKAFAQPWSDGVIYRAERQFPRGYGDSDTDGEGSPPGNTTPPDNGGQAANQNLRAAEPPVGEPASDTRKGNEHFGSARAVPAAYEAGHTVRPMVRDDATPPVLIPWLMDLAERGIDPQRTLADLAVVWEYLRTDPQWEPDPKHPPDAAIVLGSNDIGTAAVAANQTRLHVSHYPVVFSGYRGEAGRFSTLAEKFGLSSDRTLLELNARNTQHNVLLAKSVLAEHGYTPRSVDVYCAPQHARRVFATAVKNWPGIRITIVTADVSLPIYLAYGLRADPAASPTDPTIVVIAILHELRQLRIYPHHGYTIEQLLPEPDYVVAAYGRLAEAFPIPEKKPQHRQIRFSANANPIVIGTDVGVAMGGAGGIGLVPALTELIRRGVLDTGLPGTVDIAPSAERQPLRVAVRFDEEQNTRAWLNLTTPSDESPGQWWSAEAGLSISGNTRDTTTQVKNLISALLAAGPHAIEAELPTELLAVVVESARRSRSGPPADVLLSLAVQRGSASNWTVQAEAGDAAGVRIRVEMSTQSDIGVPRCIRFDYVWRARAGDAIEFVARSASLVAHAVTRGWAGSASVDESILSLVLSTMQATAGESGCLSDAVMVELNSDGPAGGRIFGTRILADTDSAPTVEQSFYEDTSYQVSEQKSGTPAPGGEAEDAAGDTAME